MTNTADEIVARALREVADCGERGIAYGSIGEELRMRAEEISPTASSGSGLVEQSPEKEITPAITAEEIRDLESSVNPEYRSSDLGGRFMFNDATLKAVRALKGLDVDQTIAALAEIFKDAEVNMNEAKLATDMLRGAEEIADFMGENVRRIYQLAATGGLPVFKIGSIICARKSTIMNYIAAQEQRAMGTAQQ
jgi:hypothetical protein